MRTLHRRLNPYHRLAVQIAALGLIPLAALGIALTAHAQTQPSGTWANNVMPISPSVQTGTDANGNPVYAPKPGFCVIATPDVLTATPAAATYQVAAPLDGVWAGDDPKAPTQTVELCFPDQATAEVTLSAYWTPTPVQQGPS